MECKVCWKVFITPQDAREHYNIFKSHENFEVVLKNKPFECEFCKVRFNTLEDLNQHKKIHDKSNEVPETTEEEKYFRKRKEKDCTDTHKKPDNVLQTRSTKIFECDICGETFKQMKYLDTHTLIHKTNYKTSQSEKYNRQQQQVSKKLTRNDHNDDLTNKITDKESLTQDNNNSFSKTEFFFEDSTFSQVSDSADVKLVELNAKTIELSSSDDELNDEHYDEPYNERDDDCDEELDMFEAGKSCVIKKEKNVGKELDCDLFDNFNINKVKKNDEKNSIIPHIKIENNFDDNMSGGYESDDFPLDELIKREKLKRLVKKEENSNAKNGEIKTETPKPAKPPRKKRTVKKETTAKVTNKRNSSKSKVEKNKVPKEEIGEAVELVIQPDIFFDKDSDTKKNVDNDVNNMDNPDNVPSKHKCSTCGERRSNKRLLQQHKQIHNGLGETECKVCRKVFGTPHDVLDHFDSFRKEKTDKHYQEGRPYQCKDCDSRFIHLKHLYEHRKIHIGDKKYVCKICGKSFLRKQGLQWHLETHLSDEMNAEGILNLQGVKVRENIKNKKLFVCDMCGHEFKQSSQLKIHINRHVKLKRFTCTVCSKSFVTPRDLLKHSRTHTGERPYKCAYCEKAFIDSGDKIKHERLHTGEKPYACQTCGKKFTFSSGLRTHERAVHFGLKRYNCDKCTRGFSNKSCLLKHKAKIHLQK